MSDKPLHVQVAEALGTFHAEHDWDARDWVNQGCRRECGDRNSKGVCAPHYDTDWSATGPLIERLGIDLETWSEPGKPAWEAYSRTEFGGGPTPLVAVCRLILDMKAEGKLT